MWLKVFNVKPKVVDGEHEDCGGAMISKLPNTTWPKGAFVETVKIWQQEWFYITEPRRPNWAAIPEFRSGPPMRLTSWNTKGLDWGSQTEVQALQMRITNMLGKNIGLTNMVQIMLFCRILPCQCRTSPVWEFKPEDPRTLQHFLGTMHEGMWKLLFLAQKSWPMEIEDVGLNAKNPATPVSV